MPPDGFETITVSEDLLEQLDDLPGRSYTEKIRLLLEDRPADVDADALADVLAERVVERLPGDPVTTDDVRAAAEAGAEAAVREGVR